MTLSWAFSIVVRVTSVSYLFSGRQKQGSNVYVGRSTYTLDGWLRKANQGLSGARIAQLNGRIRRAGFSRG